MKNVLVGVSLALIVTATVTGLSSSFLPGADQSKDTTFFSQARPIPSYVNIEAFDHNCVTHTLIPPHGARYVVLTPSEGGIGGLWIKAGSATLNIPGCLGPDDLGAPLQSATDGSAPELLSNSSAVFSVDGPISVGSRSAGVLVTAAYYK